MYDVIIVGARVAGSATALLLARRGLKVLVVDRATFPSDTLSTHQVQLPGVARLARWGVLEKIMAAGTPATRSIGFHQVSAGGDRVEFTGTVPAADGVDFTCCPRRTVLDAVLVDAARAAGADVWENAVVEEVSTRDGQVVGIRGQRKGGASIEERAPLVVGADGKHSLVAKTVAAPAYRTHPVLSMACYSYWEGVSTSGGEVYGAPGRALGIWPTNDGRVVTYCAWPAARFGELRGDLEAAMASTLDCFGLTERFGDATRVEPVRATPDLPNQFRKPYGPGWALVGDAGLVLDPITGLGISDALRDAELLADAVVAGAMQGYQKARDKAARPMYDFTVRLAAMRAVTPAELRMFRALSTSPADADTFVGVLTGGVPLRSFMSPGYLIHLVGVRGFIDLARSAR
jgi:2-polyprenyl-6-methoxyphenol hydroxylase-like FAD-dependent oxidoreductase